MPNLNARLSLAALLLVVTGRAVAQSPPPFELRNGDRVVLVGDTLIEREQHYGYLELALTTRFPDRHVTFRNIGWSADTPADDFTYTTQPLPVVTDVSPAYGGGTGGTAVTITGMNFATGQQFQTDAGQSFTDVQCSSATTCTAKTPARPAVVGSVPFQTLTSFPNRSTTNTCVTQPTE